jgi:hypothetical protein
VPVAGPGPQATGVVVGPGLQATSAVVGPGLQATGVVVANLSFTSIEAGCPSDNILKATIDVAKYTEGQRLPTRFSSQLSFYDRHASGAWIPASQRGPFSLPKVVTLNGTGCTADNIVRAFRWSSQSSRCKWMGA